MYVKHRLDFAVISPLLSSSVCSSSLVNFSKRLCIPAQRSYGWREGGWHGESPARRTTGDSVLAEYYLAALRRRWPVKTSTPSPAWLLFFRRCHATQLLNRTRASGLLLLRLRRSLRPVFLFVFISTAVKSSLLSDGIRAERLSTSLKLCFMHVCIMWANSDSGDRVPTVNVGGDVCARRSCVAEI